MAVFRLVTKIDINVRAQGQAGLAALNFDLPITLIAELNSGKPRCLLVPCSILLANL